MLFNVATNFPIAKKKILWFLQNVSTNYKKIILKFVVLIIAFARLGSILPVIREITKYLE
jgi:hypothetical protein